MTATVDVDGADRQPASPPTERVVAIMELVGSQPRRSFSLAEITRELGISRATGHAIVTTLASHNWLVRDGAGAYSRGPGIASLTGTAEERIYQGILRGLAESTSAQAFLARRDQNSLVVIDTAGESTSGMRIDRQLRMPLVAPFGRDYIAYGSKGAQRAWLEGVGKPSTTLAHRMSTVLTEIRERGYVIERLSREYVRVYTALRALGADSEPDAITARLARAFADLTVIDVLSSELNESSTHRIATISAPVFDADGLVAMSVSAAPFADLTGVEVKRIGEQVRAAARNIGQHLTQPR